MQTLLLLCVSVLLKLPIWIPGRQKEASSRRILDESVRRRRARKALEALEQDNFHDDPHANLVMSKKAPKFEESLDGSRNKDRKRRTRSSEYFKQK